MTAGLAVTYRHEWGIGWIAARPAWMLRASHALATTAACGSSTRSTATASTDGSPSSGACAASSSSSTGTGATAPRWRRHGVPLLRTPFDRVPGAPFEPVAVLHRPGWSETAL